MKKYLVLFFLLASLTSFGQFSNYTNINGRYKWIAGKFDSTFTIPSGTTPSLRVGGGTGPGALFYSTTDSTVYQYTGTRWTRLRGTDTAHVVSAYVRNTTASTMTAGQVVYINGSTGTTPTIALAVNTADSTSAMTFGFVRGTIAPNGFGWITTFGPLEGVNTNAYTEGEVIYLDSIPGQFTHDKPQAPYHMVTLGYIVKKSGGNGTIFAKIQNGYELDELHNVRITSPVRNNGILAYDSVARLWKDTTLSAIGGVTGSGTSGQVAYWTGTSSQSGSNNLFWDNANGRLGIGTNAPSYRLHNVGSSGFDNGLSGDAITFLNDGFIKFASTRFRAFSTAFQFQDNSFNIRVQLNMTSAISYFNSGGNYHFGGTTDGGQRLQVTGDVLFKGSGNTSGTTALNVQNSDGTSMVRVLNDGKLVFSSLAAIGFPYIAPYDGITNTPSITNGSHLLFVNNNTDNSNGSPAGFGFVASFSPQAGGTPSLIRTSGTFAQSANSAGINVAHLVYTINQTGTANGITRGLYVNPTLTAAADWRSIEWSNNSGWGLYGAGTANNYLAGSLGIGTSILNNSNIRIGKTITGGTSVNSIISESPITSTVTNAANVFVSTSTTQNATFTLSNLRHFWAAPDAKGASSTITNEFGFVAGSSLTNGTNNYGFYGDIASGTGRWNLYMNGTAANYMNGNLLLGSTTDGGQKLQVTGTSRFTNTLTNTVGGFVHSSAVGSNDAFYTSLSSNVRFYVNADGYTKSTSALISDTNGLGTINASAILEVSSTTKGFLPPRMTNAQMVAIATPAAGLVVYDTTNNKLNVYDGTNWVTLH